MLSAPYTDFLQQEGFQRIGSLDYRLHLSVWWNPAPDKLLQIIILKIGDSALIRGDKSYYLKSVSADGETWARDIGLLHDYLEGHFPELRVSFSHFRDVPPHLAQREVQRRMAVEAPTQPTPTVEEIAQLQTQLQAMQRELNETAGMMAMLSGESDLLTGYMHRQTRAGRAQIDQLHDHVERQKERLGLLQHLQREYQQKGSAAVYTFSINSNIQVAEDPPRFRDTVQAVVKDLQDLNRYQVMQKLGGGRLNIQVAEAAEPVIVWIEQWLGGALTPMQFRRMSPHADSVRQAVEEHVIVTPDHPIIVDDHTRHADKHLAARVMSDVLRRLDKTEAAAERIALSSESLPADAMPLTLGWRVDDKGKLVGSASFPLTQMGHISVSGTTGGGKSFLARVLVEEAAQHKQLSVLVLDPRNQWLGILVPEDRPKILQQYDEFGLKADRARGLAFEYFAPGLPYVTALPEDIPSLAVGRSVVSFKGLDDQERCTLASKILDAVFERCTDRESENPRLLVVVDEAQLFTRKRLDESAKQAAAQTERALDRIAREGRKFGIVLALVSQTMKDFGYELASIRQMTTTKIFLRNSDREIEYAADIIGDGRLLVQLPTGTALVHNANWGVVRIRVRPPHSKVFEFGDAEIRKLVGRDRDPSRTISTEAQTLLAVIMQHGSTSTEPLNMSRAAEFAGITSKRRFLELIGELEAVGVIRTKKLLERGRPRVIELLMSSPSQ